MKLKELFNTENPQTFLEWYGWSKTGDGHGFLFNQSKRRPFVSMSDKAHQFLSQPFTKDMVIRPDEPVVLWQYEGSRMEQDEQAQHEEQKRLHRQWQNWQPVFLGDWKIKDGEFYYKINDGWNMLPFYEPTIDGVIYEWPYNSGLQLNPEYEI